MAPILSFTAEEAWTVIHPGKDEGYADSVMLFTPSTPFPRRKAKPG